MKTFISDNKPLAKDKLDQWTVATGEFVDKQNRLETVAPEPRRASNGGCATNGVTNVTDDGDEPPESTDLKEICRRKMEYASSKHGEMLSRPTS